MGGFWSLGVSEWRVEFESGGILVAERSRSHHIPLSSRRDLSPNLYMVLLLTMPRFLTEIEDSTESMTNCVDGFESASV